MDAKSWISLRIPCRLPSSPPVCVVAAHGFRDQFLLSVRGHRRPVLTSGPPRPIFLMIGCLLRQPKRLRQLASRPRRTAVHISHVSIPTVSMCPCAPLTLIPTIVAATRWHTPREAANTYGWPPLPVPRPRLISFLGDPRTNVSYPLGSSTGLPFESAQDFADDAGDRGEVNRALTRASC